MKHMMDNSHYIIMFFIMIIAGALSTMNVWVDKISDICISANDFLNERVDVLFYGNYLSTFICIYIRSSTCNHKYLFNSNTNFCH